MPDQVCVSPTRFYVQQGIYERFVKAVSERFAATPVGDGLKAEQRGLGRWPTPRRPQTMEAMIKDAVDPSAPGGGSAGSKPIGRAAAGSW